VLPVRGLLDGRIRGFTARRVDDSDERAPKYINSPTNRAFRKGHELFGAWEARQLLRERRGQIESLVVCEGPIDVVRVDCAGRWAAVAPCGTALTRAQAEWIVALARAHDLPVVLAFDGDGAGEEAAWRAWDLLVDLHAPGLSMAELPMGLDPAELSEEELVSSIGLTTRIRA
jgi:DNA primase